MTMRRKNTDINMALKTLLQTMNSNNGGQWTYGYVPNNVQSLIFVFTSISRINTI